MKHFGVHEEIDETCVTMVMLGGPVPFLFASFMFAAMRSRYSFIASRAYASRTTVT